MARRNRATMSEIAAAAGVSVPTVSKVVNGRPDVAPTTRRTIEGLLLEHGYSSPRARTHERVGLIDLVFVDLGSPWAMAILAGVEEVAYRAGTGVVVSAVHGRHRTRPDERWLETVAARRSDGVLLILSELSPGQQARLDALGVPVVTVDPAGTPAPGSPSVGATNWAGGLAAAEHLIGLGHSRIAVIGGPTDVLCSRARVDGYRAAMGAADLADPTGLRPLRRLPQPDRLPGDHRAARPARRRRRPSSSAPTRWPSARTRRSTSGACGCPTT